MYQGTQLFRHPLFRIPFREVAKLPIHPSRLNLPWGRGPRVLLLQKLLWGPSETKIARPWAPVR